MEHYKTRPTETIDAIRTALTEEEFRGYCIGNVMKYALRYQHKGGDDDLLKARKYIDFLIRLYRSEPILGDEEEEEE